MTARRGRNTKPTTTMRTLSAHIQPAMGSTGTAEASTMARPDVPPNAKCWGDWNSTIEKAITMSEKLSARKKRQRRGACSRFSAMRLASAACSGDWASASGSSRTRAGSMGRKVPVGSLSASATADIS